MFVTITTVDDKLFTLQVSPDIKVAEFKELCAQELSLPVAQFNVTFNGVVLRTENTLKDSGVIDYDVVMVETIAAAAAVIPPRTVPAPLPLMDFSTIQVPTSQRRRGPTTTEAVNSPSNETITEERDPSANAELVSDMLRSNPDTLALLGQNNPRLAEAYLSGDIARFRAVLQEQQNMRHDRERHRLLLMESDPFNEEAQRMIENEIRENIIEQNREAAMEYHPEAFGTVVMLYINCRVNGRPVKAFVDSGAQITIMSSGCAERCGIKHLIDHRWSGTARGVGVQRILGRIHMVQMQIENVFLPCSFSVLPDQSVDMLLGLDMLKRHQCCIDLKSNVLKIGTTGTETRFLAEGELPAEARLSGNEIIELEDRELASTLQRSMDEAIPEKDPGTSKN